LLAQIEAAQRKQSTGERVGLVRGRHMIDWVPTYQQWLREGREDEALALLLEIIEAAQQLARIDGAAPPSTYTRQAVAIYQGRGDREGELAVLERYERACPSGAGDAALLKHLAGLRES